MKVMLAALLASVVAAVEEVAGSPKVRHMDKIIGLVVIRRWIGQTRRRGLRRRSTLW